MHSLEDKAQALAQQLVEWRELEEQQKGETEKCFEDISNFTNELTEIYSRKPIKSQMKIIAAEAQKVDQTLIILRKLKDANS